MPPSSRRMAFISDVHANIDALEAVLRDIRQQGVTEIVCLGDIVGYGAAPAKCVEIIASTCAVTVLGNHEAMTGFDVVYLEEMPARIKRPLELARKELSPLELIWLQQLPLTATVGAVSVVHACFYNSATFPYLDRSEVARQHLEIQPTDVSFHGHSHVPVIWEDRPRGPKAYRPQLRTTRLAPTGRYSINPGSVGQPRDGDPRASYAIYDEKMRDVIFRRVPYDIEAACRRMSEAGIPPHNGERLRKGE